jgi:hypothetical protein
VEGWGHGFRVVRWPGMLQALGSIPSTEKKKERRRMNILGICTVFIGILHLFEKEVELVGQRDLTFVGYIQMLSRTFVSLHTLLQVLLS